eukprot:727031-Rhodomonas_salina.1
MAAIASFSGRVAASSFCASSRSSCIEVVCPVVLEETAVIAHKLLARLAVQAELFPLVLVAEASGLGGGLSLVLHLADRDELVCFELSGSAVVVGAYLAQQLVAVRAVVDGVDVFVTVLTDQPALSGCDE